MSSKVSDSPELALCDDTTSLSPSVTVTVDTTLIRPFEVERVVLAHALRRVRVLKRNQRGQRHRRARQRHRERRRIEQRCAVAVVLARDLRRPKSATSVIGWLPAVVSSPVAVPPARASA